MIITAECPSVYIRPMWRGIVLYWPDGSDIYLEEWLEKHLNKGEYSFTGGSTLYNVKISLEWDRAETDR